MACHQPRVGWLSRAGGVENHVVIPGGLFQVRWGQSFQARSADMRKKMLLAILGVVMLVVGAVHGWYYLGGLGWSASPEQLAEQALQGSTVKEKTKAAVRLGDCGSEARDDLRRVYQESDLPEVRAACIQGLGAMEDYDSMDLLLEAMNDKSLLVRGRAGSVVNKMIMGPDVRTPFRASDPEEDRKKAIESLRKYWEELRGSPLLNQRRRKLQEGRENET